MRPYPALLAALLAAGTLHAHLCDDVWRQADKLVLKPDVTNLVVKDTAEFDVHMQHNMDRAIACAVKLRAESPAFDVKITPPEGYNPIRPGQRYIYHVLLTAKAGQTSGSYPITFHIVGNDTANRPRELKKVDLSIPGASSGAASGGRSKPSVAVPGLAGNPAPAIDGNPSDKAWKMVAGNFQRAAGVPASRGTVVRACCDARTLYLAFGCTGAAAEDRLGDDAVHVLLARSDQPGSSMKVTLTGAGVLSIGEPGKTVATSPASAKAAVTRMPGVWFGEVSIPASLLGQDSFQKDQPWLVNFLRESKIEPAETSFWVGAPDTCLKVESFAELSFLP